MNVFNNFRFGFSLKSDLQISAIEMIDKIANKANFSSETN